MKTKIFSILLLFLLFACVESEEIRTTKSKQRSIDERVDSELARTKSLCSAGYGWLTGSSGYTVIIPNIHWKQNIEWYTYNYPCGWCAGINPSNGQPYQITFTVTNIGAATFKFSTKNGAVWNTLAPGASTTFNKNMPECLTGCDINLIVFDFYRLSCGYMETRVRQTSVTGPHTIVTSYAPGINNTWNAPACTL